MLSVIYFEQPIGHQGLTCVLYDEKNNEVLVPLVYDSENPNKDSPEQVVQFVMSEMYQHLYEDAFQKAVTCTTIKEAACLIRNAYRRWRTLKVEIINYDHSRL